jgi:hypothetical protein
MRRVVLAAAVLAIVVVAALIGARAVGLGTRAAPESRLYVAISRSDDETAAREIEVIDTASGERSLIDVGTRITALALAPDRRTLYVGADDGRLLFVDPTNGAIYAHVLTRRASWILTPPGRDDVILVGADERGISLTRVNVTDRREAKSILITGAAPGRPSLRGGEVLLPYVIGRDNSLGLYDSVSLARSVASLVARVVGRQALGLPQVQLTPQGSAAYLAQWDSSPAAVRLVTGVAGETKPQELLLGVTSPSDATPLRGLREIQSSLASAADGALHVCVGNAEYAARYVVGAEQRLVGSECGQFARVVDRLYLAVRGKPRVAVIDAASGRILRDLLLPGIPVFVASGF